MQSSRFMMGFNISAAFTLSARLPSLASAMAVAVGLLAGCTTEPTREASVSGDSAKVSQVMTAEATVEAVDQQNRLVTLKREDGSKFTFLAGPEVRNLPQIAAGDKVKARYMESLLASLKKPGEAVKPASTATIVSRAEPGAAPGATAGQQITVTVRIESVDTEKNRVAFTLPSGAMRIFTVRQPEMQEYIKGLKPGDQVEITYTEAVAISVEKPAGEGK
jgi:translation elongation factor P/translation initiation factor 5A